MHHHETPDHDGWYWVKYSEEDHYIAHFHADVDGPPRLDLFLRDRDGDYGVLHLQEKRERRRPRL